MADSSLLDELLDTERDATDRNQPYVNVPEPSYSENISNVDPDVLSIFWRLVIVVNVVLFSISLGFMFLVFENDATIGGLLVATGFLFGVYGFIKYRGFRQNRTQLRR